MLIIHAEFMSWLRDKIGSILDLFKLLQIPAILGAENSSRPEGQLSRSFKPSGVSVLQGVDFQEVTSRCCCNPYQHCTSFLYPLPRCLFWGYAKKTTVVACCCLRTYRESPPGREINGSAPPKGPPEATSNSNITRLQDRKYH